MNIDLIVLNNLRHRQAEAEREVLWAIQHIKPQYVQSELAEALKHIRDTRASLIQLKEGHNPTEGRIS